MLFLKSVAAKGPKCESVKTEEQKYHLEDEGHRPTDADGLVEAQLQILSRKEEHKSPQAG